MWFTPFLADLVSLVSTAKFLSDTTGNINMSELLASF